MVECLNPGFEPLYFIYQAWWGEHAFNSSSWKVDPGGSEVQDNIGYIVSLRSAWDKYNPVPKETNQIETSSQLVLPFKS